MSNAIAPLLLLAMATAMVGGCTAGSHSSGVNVEPYPIGARTDSPEFLAARAKNAEHDSQVRGIRYYQRSPYLLVHSDGRGGIVWRILHLPDPTKKSAIDFQVMTSTFSTTLEFENGTLKDFSDVGDSTALPLAILTTVEQVLPAIVKMAFDEVQPGTAPQKFPAPHLYKIVVAGNTVVFRGGEGDVPIQVQGVAKQ